MKHVTVTSYTQNILIWGSQFQRASVHFHHSREHVSEHSAGAGIRNLDPYWQKGGIVRHWPGVDLWNLKAFLQWHTSSHRTTPLNRSKQFHQLETEHSNICSYRGHFHSNHHMVPLKWSFFSTKHQDLVSVWQNKFPHGYLKLKFVLIGL